MAKGMTKTVLVRTMAEKLEITNKQAAAGLELLAELAVKETKKNGEFTIPGIGKLVKTPSPHPKSNWVPTASGGCPIHDAVSPRHGWGVTSQQPSPQPGDQPTRAPHLRDMQLVARWGSPSPAIRHNFVILSEARSA